MSDTPAYDTDNVFARILRGELPSERVYEDEHTLAFMDIMPRADGHVLVIPKAPSRNLLDIEAEDLAHLAQTVQRVARAVMRAFDADGVTIQQFNDAGGEQVVCHTHFHEVPRYDGAPLRPPGTMADPAALAQNPQKIKNALGF